MKHFRATSSYGTTFGMNIETNTAAYREMKRNTKPQTVKGHYGIEVSVLVCPYKHVAGVMREAGWLVAEKQDFRCFEIEGLFGGEQVFIIYPDGIHI